MSFKTHIKLGGINNLSDARFAAAAGVTYIGFCFDPVSPQYIPPIKAKELIDWISGLHIIAEFGEQKLDEIRDITELLKIEIAEAGNSLLPEELQKLGVAVMKKINTDNFTHEQLMAEMNAYHKVADVFHLYSETGMVPAGIAGICEEYKVIYGYAVDPSNINEVIDVVKPFGVNIIGGEEEKPGIKDFDQLNELFEMITI